jgi:hypothetical protein
MHPVGGRMGNVDGMEASFDMVEGLSLNSTPKSTAGGWVTAREGTPYSITT